MDNIVYNTNLELLQARFPEGQLLGLREVADYVGCDYRTLEARKDFPIVRMGKSPRVPRARLAKWLTEAEGRG